MSGPPMSAPPTTLHGGSPRQRWRALGKGTRAVIVVGLSFLVANIALSVVDSATRGADETSPTSSSLSTGRRGLAGYASLLRRFGRSVRSQRGAIDRAALDPSTTVVVLDPDSVDDASVRHLRAFVERGGRLVAGGGDPTWVHGLVDGAPSWSFDAHGSYHANPAAPEQGFRTLRSDALGSWDSPGRTTVLAGTRHDALAVAADVGRGRVILLADSSPLQNHLLGRSDNAAFGLSVLGNDRSVVFAEGVHGYGNDTGLVAIPGRWKVAIALTLLAALLLMLAQGRVLGGPEEARRPLPPPRGAYISAMAEVLQGSKQPAPALAPLQQRARVDLARRLGVGHDASDEQFRATALAAGWSVEDLDALTTPAHDRHTVLAVGRAWAHVEGDLP